MEILYQILLPILLATLLGVIGYIYKVILDLSKVQAGTVKVLDMILKNQEVSNANFMSLKSEFDRMKGQHDAIVQSGEILSKHGLKKSSG